MRAIRLKDLWLRKTDGHYTLTLQAYGREPVSMQTDGDLGQIMSGISVLVTAIGVQHGMRVEKAPICTRSGYVLDRFEITPLRVAPYRWELVMEKGPFCFTRKMDDNLELVVTAWMEAMAFFGQKEGLIVGSHEGFRNRDRAGEQGFLQGSA